MILLMFYVYELQLVKKAITLELFDKIFCKITLNLIKITHFDRTKETIKRLNEFKIVQAHHDLYSIHLTIFLIFALGIYHLDLHRINLNIQRSSSYNVCL